MCAQKGRPVQSQDDSTGEGDTPSTDPQRLPNYSQQIPVQWSQGIPGSVHPGWPRARSASAGGFFFHARRVSKLQEAPLPACIFPKLVSQRATQTTRAAIAE